MSRYAWWYTPVFLVLELIQALIGLLTLTLWQPALTTAFAWWFMRRFGRVSYDKV